jgi:membrane protein implicated in regulation of membrane protease activity
MLAINDAFDAILLGMFLFGLLFTAGSLFLGVADLGFEADGTGDHAGPSVLNLGVMLTFVTWLGGVGYLARNSFNAPLLLSLIIGVLVAVIAAAGIFRLLRYVRSRENVLRAEDYRLPGQIARVSSSIRAGGTGEVVYEQRGVRQVAAARSAQGDAVPRGTEVVILSVEKGIVYVDLWDRLVEDREQVTTAQLTES